LAHLCLSAKTLGSGSRAQQGSLRMHAREPYDDDTVMTIRPFSQHHLPGVTGTICPLNYFYAGWCIISLFLHSDGAHWALHWHFSTLLSLSEPTHWTPSVRHQATGKWDLSYRLAEKHCG
jgi:hypothetical protein